MAEMSIHVETVSSRRQRRDFVLFPWKVYRADPYWVPPLITEQMDILDPQKGAIFRLADVELFLARKNRHVVGTIAAFINHPQVDKSNRIEGKFGFFEVIEDYSVAETLLDAAYQWLRKKGAQAMVGPFSFTDNERPGILISKATCPPVLLQSHNPPYYKDFLEKYGFQKDHDLYAWRAFRSQIGEELKNVPPELYRVADAAKRHTNINIRKIRLDAWDEEVKLGREIFNLTLRHLPGFIPMSESEFSRMCNQLRLFVDPDLALFAEADGKAVGFCVAIPDVNRVLIHLNGRLFPFNWMRIKRLLKNVEVVSFKLMGVLEEYRHRGIEALMYMEAIEEIYRKGYEWIDGSVTSEFNPMINLIANRLGAERYRHYRVYRLDF